MLPALYALTLFASAALLFLVQPMAGKDLLPLAGGTPAVWATCLVFFQALLLLGYLYADRLAPFSPRCQLPAHLAVSGLGLLALFFLRPNPDWIPDDRDYPTLGLLAYLAALVGWPFFALSANAPLLQRWFSHTSHPTAGDPYYLYAASNAGSLVGLLAYPFAVEPLLPLGDQFGGWSAGYAVLIALIALCGLAAIRDGGNRSNPVEPDRSSEADPSAVTPARVLRWVVLAALPSSLLLSVTSHLTTDVAPVPLLWVVPLALYLVTFIVTFGYWPDFARMVMGRVTPAFLTFLAVALVTRANEPAVLVALVHLTAFVAAALLCHGELAAARPPRQFLTRFYLAVSFGGVLGGLFNAVIAPVIFSSVGPAEYPLGVVLVALVRPRPKRDVPSSFAEVDPNNHTSVRSGTNRRDLTWIAAFSVVTLILTMSVPRLIEIPTDAPDADTLIPRLVRGGLTAGVPAALAFALVRKPLRFALCLAVLFLSGRIDPGGYGRTLITSRNFFGTLRVTESDDGRYVRLVHGTTLHGQQSRHDTGPTKPLMYYHPRGPVGRLFEKLPPERKRRVAVVGLGCGAMAAYAEPGQSWTFYEIDPAVVRIARDSGHFTFLRECRADECRIVTGDARRQLDREPDGSYDLIALDAFSSDAIPVHLLTKEALALYTRKLAPDGVLAFHLSNRYLDLPPLVARAGADQDPPFTGRLDDDIPSDAERADGKFPSIWMVLFRDPANLGLLGKDIRWQPMKPTPGPVWRDDFSNLLAAWKRGTE